MLPEGWHRLPLGDIAQVTSGGTPDRSNPAFWGGDIPWVTTGEIQFNTITDTAEKITEAGLKNSSAKLFPVGTLLMAMYGQGKTRGQVARLGVSAATNQACAAILLRGVNSSEFYYQVLASQYESLRELGNAGTQQNLNGGIIKQIPVPVPPSGEQHDIARALAVWDSAIATSERLLANSRRQRRALLGTLLHAPTLSTEVEDRARSGSVPPSVQSGIPKLATAPDGWTRVRLGSHLREVARPIKLKPDQLYTLVTVRRSRGGVTARGVFRGRDIKTPAQFEVRAGDFLISKRQIVHGACGVVPPELDGAIVSNEYAVLNTYGGIDLQFLRILSESIYFQQTCFHSSIGVHVEKMIFKTERWLSFPFNIPPLQRQRELVRIAETIESEIDGCKRQIELLRKEKAALMQQLLTGKRRLKSAAESADAA